MGRSRGRRSTILIGAAALGLLAGVVVAVPAQASDAFGAAGKGSAKAHSWTAPKGPVPVVRKLNNPRQLALTTGGSLLIAEAGKGGTACDPSGENCVGTTGSVSWVAAPSVQKNSKPLRIVKGLISAAGPDGTFAVGADGVSARSLSKIYSIMTFAPPEMVPPTVPAVQLGKLLVSRPGGTAKIVPNADASLFETTKDPDKQGVESNPYAVLELSDRILIADAAGNSILQYKHGKLSLFATLPNVTSGACAGRPNDAGTTGCDAVPTSLAEGPDGAIYVGGLGSEVPGAGRVWKLDRRTGAIKKSWDNLTSVTGVAVDRKGGIYASQLFTVMGPQGPDFMSGKLTHIPGKGARKHVAVPMPAGVAVDRHANVYVAAWSIATEAGAFGAPNSDGQVWRLRF